MRSTFFSETPVKSRLYGSVDNVDKEGKKTGRQIMETAERENSAGKTYFSNSVKNALCKLKIHIQRLKFSPTRMWIMWIIYFPRICSPTVTIFPAPIVINRSLFIQVFSKNFSISSKEGK